MRAIAIKDGKGPADALYIDENVETPKPAQGQILVKVNAFGLNRMDLNQRVGNYPPPPGASTILGVEFAGTVAELGPGTENAGFKLKDRVFGLIPGGAYAEYVVASPMTLMHTPDKMDDVTAAGIPEVWFTASQVLKFVGNIEKGESVLFHAGTSSVGIAAVQIAQLCGAKRVFATVGSDEKKEFIKNKLVLPGTNPDDIIPINYRTEDFVQATQKVDSNGVDLIIDPVGQSYFQRDLAAVAKDGKVVLMGFMSGPVVENANLAPILGKRITVRGTNLRARTLEYQKDIRDFVEGELLPKILSKELSHFTEKVFTFDQVADAHKLLESNKTMGKVIVTI